MQQSPPADEILAIRAALLAFYDTTARPLPWRQTRDPYAIWISEVMAQQTRVATVVPFYERWLGRFPDVAALADASLDDVLKAWEGLGYYSRARNLHRAARLLRERHDCTVPENFDALRALPGVGEYTAGAVTSIAFGARHAAVDGNVRRVLSRLLDHRTPSHSLLRKVADTLVPPDRPGEFNQALMDLGATICTPKTPRCGRCPITSHCASRAAGSQEDRPAPAPKSAVPTIQVATAVVQDPRGRLMIVRRPAHGLLAGMWTFPGIAVQPDEDPAARALELARGHITRSAGPRGRPSGSPETDAGLADATPRRLGVIEHLFSHRRERYHCFLFRTRRPGHEGEEVAWIDEADSPYALPRAQQQIRSLALADGGRHSAEKRTGRTAHAGRR